MLSDAPGARVWAFVVFVVALLTDKLDGDLARWLHQETEWGKILDPLADKIGIASAAVVFLLRGLLPAWFVVALITRDLLIFCGGLFLKIRHGVVLPSNMTGKWAIGVIALTFGLAMLGAHDIIVAVSLWGSVVMMVLSLVLYVRRFAAVVTEARA
jgi:cardiolipin synthase